MHSPFQHHLYSIVVWCVCVCGVCVIGNRIQPVCSKYSQCPLNTASALSIQPVPSQYSQCPLNTASALSIQPVPSQYTLCPPNTACALSIHPVPSQYSLCPAITALTNGRVPEGEAGDDAGLEHLIHCGASHCRRQRQTHRDNSSKEAAMSDSATLLRTKTAKLPSLMASCSNEENM